MGYFCFTLIRQGDLHAAAKRLRVASKVLSELRDLTSESGDLLTARKLLFQRGARRGDKPTTRPLAPEEAEWIKDTIKAIIKNLAQPGDKLTLADLPPLPPIPGAPRPWRRPKR
jgi:hypothetical protein